MKRLWATAEYVRQQQLRKKRAARPEGSLRRRAKRRGGSPHQVSIVIPAPERLSLFDEPEPTVEFFNKVRRAMSRSGVTVRLDMSGVTMVSTDAFLMLRALFDDSSVRSSSVGGNLPSSAPVAAQFKESGFFETMSNPPADLPPPQGLLRRESSRSVITEEAARLVTFASEHSGMTPDVGRASYRTLVELMSNTHNHAAGYDPDVKKLLAEKAGTRLWFASVYCDKNTGRFQFVFVDLGVGILDSSAPRSFFQKARQKLEGYGATDLLTDIVKGEVGASVKKPGRGRGLEELRADAQNDLLPDLRVFTGSVTGNLATLSFRHIHGKIEGTVFRWGTIQSA